ncbi:phosphoglycolate phosphatase [Trichodelitschia bisporula]|uniref:Phosphoglycolate phosphatase n=1 Tax=Trichodelitschia bisporula TaxID=703511 RepID=A0A6G1IC74_9PEZI|nr:phosphoglycolate phosphatase [Trichodelitschia bisporula]
MAPVKQIMFDCDNTLVLSEQLAFEACTELANELLEKHNVDKRYTVKELLTTFVGQNFRGMMKGLQEKHNFTMPQDEMEAYVDRELGAVISKLSKSCEPCPGVIEVIERLAKEGRKMSVVSTSAKPRVVAAIEHVNLTRFFPDEHVYSAATSLNPPSSKPDPAIYLHAAREEGAEPSECVTVEDSVSGATAAMRAGIPCIGYVGVYGIEDSEEKMKEMAQALQEKCKVAAVMYDWKEFDKCLAQIEG